MPRYISLGNGSLLVCLDRFSQVRDFYFPYVGLYNHVMGNTCKIGLWDGREVLWAGENWVGKIGYEPDALVSYATYRLPNGAKFFLRDAVHPFSNIFLREIEVESPNETTVFLHHNFSLLETDVGDTAFYNPFLDAIVHFKRDVYILVSGIFPKGGIHEYAIGTKEGEKGIWLDAEDGRLSKRPIEQGAVDSIFSFQLEPTPPNNKALVWIAVGNSLRAISSLHSMAKQKKWELLRETYAFWNSWLKSLLPDFLDLPSELVDLFRKSILITRTNIDNGGAIIAANDSDIMQTARAHYSYMWGRDSAFTVLTLDKLGQIDISRRFFLFVQKLFKEGFPFLWHKYSADGSMGSSWHPWIIDEEKEIPLQEDSTAIVIYALQQHFRRYGDLEFLAHVYEEVVRNPALFMSQYISEAFGLPRPSWDLWEERRGIHLYTSAITALALFSAADLSSAVGDVENSKLFFAKGRKIWEGLKHFFKNGKCIRSFIPTPAGWLEDTTPDSSIFLLPILNIFPSYILTTPNCLEETKEALWVKTPIGGMSRYKGDWYFRQTEDLEKVPGNPWYICTMWLAQWYIERAKDLIDLKKSITLLQWAKEHSLTTGVFPEQVHPFTGEPLSVAPLTWSHTSFLSAILRYLEKRKEVQ